MYAEEQVVPVYRKFVNQHYRLSAYLHTNGANSVDGECMKLVCCVGWRGCDQLTMRAISVRLLPRGLETAFTVFTHTVCLTSAAVL
jgi:hypothetical protein